METSSLEGGFQNAPIDAAHAFRAALEVMARPGRIETVCGARPPEPLSLAAGILALTLLDSTTGLYLAPSWSGDAVRDWLRFHTGAPAAPRAEAMYAIGPWAELGPLGAYQVGVPEYPDRSATLIVELPELTAEGARLTGPGIETEAHLSLPETAAFEVNARLFPLGLDFFFTSGDRLAALPRTTKVAV